LIYSLEDILPQARDDRKGYCQEVRYGEKRDHALGISFKLLLSGQRGEVTHLQLKQKGKKI